MAKYEIDRYYLSMMWGEGPHYFLPAEYATRAGASRAASDILKRPRPKRSPRRTVHILRVEDKIVECK